MKTTKRIWMIPLLALALATVPAATVVAAEAEEAEETVKADEKVFTNDDLKRYRSLAAESTDKDKTIVADMTKKPEAGDPEGAIDPVQKKRRMTELQAEIRKTEERLAAIASRQKSLHNPFLARPQLSDEDRAASAGMDSREQMELLESEKKALMESLPGLREELATVAKSPVKKPKKVIRAGAEPSPPPQSTP